MKIILQTLIINNFKGIKSLTIDFSEGQTYIHAANEVGKTTISDAWHWLLTGKNSLDQKDFNIKNTVHTDLNRADHEVTGILLADGAPVTLKKIFREKWQKKRGEQLAEFTGNETLYYCNDVPLSQTEYQNKINGLLPESVLKMITNPLFFNSNSTNWGWQKRREVLLAIAGNINTTDVLDSIATVNNKQEITNLTMVINSGKTITEYKREISSRKTKIKEDLKAIPTRIDEINRNLPEAVDYLVIEQQIATLEDQIKTFDQIISDKNSALQAEHNVIQERQGKIHKLTTRRNEIAFEANNSIMSSQNELSGKKNEVINEIARLEREISVKKSLLSNAQGVKSAHERNIAELRIKWSTLNESEIKLNDHDFECPTCKRAFESSDIEATKAQMVSNFNTDKASKLEEINETGLKLVGYVADEEQLINETETILNDLTEKLSAANVSLNELSKPAQTLSVDEILSGNDEYIQLGADIAKLEAENSNVSAIDNTEVLENKKRVSGEIDALKRQLNTKDALDKAKGRINELKGEESTLAQQLADLEKTEFLIEDFTRSKMDILESRINGKFEHVTFKLFDRQINGGEVETCETMYKGVPFSDLNTAGKIWAGMDIINTLSRHYQVQAPIFLDNRESVSNIPKTNSQVINLIVSPSDKVVRVVTEEHLELV
jgi:DNA repair protein SbcC/Rad50